MDIRREILDYSDNVKVIEKYLTVKGGDKYSEFLSILKTEGIETTWDNVSGLYRYDKRLLINNFKYLSFFEEYCRAWIIREGRKQYDKIQPLSFGELMHEMISFGELEKMFDVIDPDCKLRNVKDLRNWVSHNRIMLKMEFCGYDVAVQSLHDLLPEDYREGYVKDLKGCSKNIEVSKFFEFIPS